MWPVILASLGMAGASAAKSEFIDRPRAEARQRARDHETAAMNRVSGYSGAGPVAREYVEKPDTWGALLSGGISGAQFGQDITKFAHESKMDDMTEDLMKSDPSFKRSYLARRGGANTMTINNMDMPAIGDSSNMSTQTLFGTRNNPYMAKSPWSLFNTR